MPYLISCFSYSFFVSLSFALENVFLFWHNCVIILYIVEVIDELYINFALSILKLNLEAFLSVFWSQNWILLIVSIDGCFYIYIYSAFHIQWVGLDMFRERRGKFWIKKKKNFKKKGRDDVALLPIQQSYPPFVWSLFSVEAMKIGLVLDIQVWSFSISLCSSCVLHIYCLFILSSMCNICFTQLILLVPNTYWVMMLDLFSFIMLISEILFLYMLK